MINQENELCFKTQSLGELRILAMIDNYALLEKMYDSTEKYIIASGFDFEQKNWNFGSYYKKFKEALENFTDRVLNNRDIQQTSKQIEEITQEMDVLRKEFEVKTLNDIKLVEYFKDKKTGNNFTSISVAGVILGGIDLRNINRENNKLNGEMEEYPYNEEQIKMIDKYYSLQKTLDRIEEYAETNLVFNDEELEY